MFDSVLNAGGQPARAQFLEAFAGVQRQFLRVPRVVDRRTAAWINLFCSPLRYRVCATCGWINTPKLTGVDTVVEYGMGAKFVHGKDKWPVNLLGLGTARGGQEI